MLDSCAFTPFNVQLWGIIVLQAPDVWCFIYRKEKTGTKNEKKPGFSRAGGYLSAERIAIATICVPTTNITRYNHIPSGISVLSAHATSVVPMIAKHTSKILSMLIS